MNSPVKPPVQPADEKFERIVRRLFTRGVRRRRVETFVSALYLGPEDIVLDLGGGDGSYLASLYPWPENIMLADLDERTIRQSAEWYGLRGYAPLDGSCILPFADRAFDGVFCSSVLEHVDDDVLFASEIRRIGRGHLVEVPHRHWPIEAHSFLPLVQYLSPPAQRFVWAVSNRIWPQKVAADFEVVTYTRKGLQTYFPDSRIVCERVFGIPKSLIAIRKDTTCLP